MCACARVRVRARARARARSLMATLRGAQEADGSGVSFLFRVSVSSTCLLLRAAVVCSVDGGRVPGLTLRGALSSIASRPLLTCVGVFCWGPKLAGYILLDCSKSSRQCVAFIIDTILLSFKKGAALSLPRDGCV